MDSLLASVLKAFEDQRKDLRAELEDIDHKESLVKQALATDGRTIARQPSVPDDKYQEVIDYLRKHPDSRQADIASHLKINSGIISQAMKVAIDRQEAEADRTGRGARYKLTKEGSNESRRRAGTKGASAGPGVSAGA